MSRERFIKQLRRVRLRMLVIEAVLSARLAITVALAVGVLSVWSDLVWDLPARVRIGAWVALALGAVITLVGRLCWAWSRSQAEHAARRLDHRGNARGEIVSAWALTQDADDDEPYIYQPLRAGMAKLAIERATALAEAVSPSRAVPATSALKALASLGMLGLLSIIVAVCAPTLVRTQWQRFRHPFADVPPYSLIVFHVEPGDTTVVYGRGLDIHVRVEGETTDRLELVVESSTGTTEAFPMFAESEDRWRATLARIVAPAKYYVRSERARSPRYDIRMITVPDIDVVRFRVVPPEYTREPVYEGELPRNGLAGLAGTQVFVTARSNRPLASGQITLHAHTSTKQVSLSPATDDEQSVAGSFEIHDSGRFTLQVTDVDGQDSQESFGGAVTRLDDQRPFIRLLQPRQMSFATPTANLPVSVAAEDDYGITRVQLYRSLNGSRPLPMEMDVAPPPPRRLQEDTYLRFANYGLVPGDEIKLFARVEDNDPAGAKGSESQVATVIIISHEDHERMVRAREGIEVLLSKYQQARRRMEAISEQLAELEKQVKAPSDSASLNEQLRQQILQLAEQLQRESAALEQLVEQKLPYDIDQHLTAELEKVAKTLQEAAAQAKELGENNALAPADAAELLAALVQRLAERKVRFESDVISPLERFREVFPLIELQSRYVALTQRQRELAERMAALAGHDREDTPELKVRMRELGDEQRRLREELVQLVDAVENSAVSLPEEPELEPLRESALQFVISVRLSGAPEAMQAAENALQEFIGTQAHERADEAARILESFVGECQQMGSQGQGCLVFHPKLSNILGQTIAQMLSDMGLSDGAGAGAGGRGGYSAQRNSLNNVGMYGADAMAGGDRANKTSSADRMGVGHADGDHPTGATMPETWLHASPTGGASGSGGGQIPLQYRQRVGNYLRRLAEELQ